MVMTMVITIMMTIVMTMVIGDNHVDHGYLGDHCGQVDQ